MKTALTIAVMLAAAASAAGDMVLVIERNPDPAPGLKSYGVYCRADTLDEAAFTCECRLDGDLSQSWFYFKGQWWPTPWVDDFWPGDDEARQRDTHLLVSPNTAPPVLIARGVNEDMDTSAFPSPVEQAYHYGQGHWLADTAGTSMAFAINPHRLSTNQPFVQVVIPDGGQARLSGRITTRSGEEYDFLDEPIPEPAFALLAAAGFPWMLRRRRRRT